MMTSAFIIAKAALHPSIADLQVAIVGVRFFGISRGVFRYLERYVSHDLNFRLLARIRVWLYQHIEPLAPAALQDYRSGDLLTRLVADVDELENFFIRVLAPPLVAIGIIALTWALLSLFSPAAALAVVVLLILAGVAFPLLVQALARRPGQQHIELRSRLNAHLVDGIQGMADLLAYGAEQRYLARVDALNQETGRVQNRLGAITALNDAGITLIMNLAVVVALALAIPAVTSSTLSGVHLAVIALGVMAAFEAVQPLPLAMQHLSATLAAARRIFQVVDTPPAVTEPQQPKPCSVEKISRKGAKAQREKEDEEERGAPTLTVRALSFRYGPNEPPALQNISFTLPPGGRIAVVGPSGAGKSTLINLLMRFWEFDQGRIELNGRDIRACSGDDVRARFSVVSQTTHIFNATLRENLLLARPTASETELWQALDQAQLADFVRSLPQGLDAWAGEMGVQLSGGEGQRLAIARAILKDAPILLLDEPTASLDAVTERALWRDLSRLMARRSVLLITHRLVGMDQMDEILVLQAGRIVERGTHEALLAAGGLYARMWALQHETIR
jgi:thiol reductant ABC exporter CydC subunit